MKTLVHIGVILVFLSAVAAIPAVLDTGFRLIELGPPPVVVLDNGQIIGQMTTWNWAQAFIFMLFDLPFASITTLLWSAINTLTLTAILVLITVESVMGVQKLVEKGVFGPDASFGPIVTIAVGIWLLIPFFYDSLLGPERQPYQVVPGSWTLALLFYSFAVVCLAMTAEAIRPLRRRAKAVAE